jgi:hypothetical protein
MIDLLREAVISWAVFGLSSGALLHSSHLLVRKYLAASPAYVRWTATGTAFVGLILVVTRSLAAVGMYNRFATTMSSLLVATVLHISWRRHRNVRGEFEPVRSWIVAIANTRGVVLLSIAAFMTGLAAYRGLLTPPWEWDSLTYHLFFAGRLVQTGTLDTFTGPFATEMLVHFPPNGDLMTAWLLLPFHSDVLAGTINLFFILLGAVALYGLGRELDVDRGDAALAACLVSLSPFLLTFVNSQMVDALVYAMLISGVLFTVRYLVARRTPEAMFAFTALGIAFGTKYTALAFGGLQVVSVIGALVVFNRHRIRAAASVTVCGLLVMTALGGSTYMANWRDTGNPLYPMDVRVAGRIIFQGSPYTGLVEQERGGIGTRYDDLAHFARMFTYAPALREPTTAGPKYLVLAVLALVSLTVVRRQRRRWLIWLVAGFGAVALLAAYLPGDGFAALARRAWPLASPRFLIAPFAVIAVVAMPAFSLLRRRLAVLPVLLNSSIVWDVFLSRPELPAGDYPLALAVGTAGIVLLGATGMRLPPWTPALRACLTVVLTAIAVAGLAEVQRARERSRWSRVATTASPDVKPLVEGWRACDTIDRPRRIALTAGWDRHSSGMNWFYYPLMGSRLQNTVEYVPVAGTDAAAMTIGRYAFDDDSKFDGWLQNIRDRRIDLVFVEAPWPAEDRWMTSHPEIFRRTKESDTFRIYETLQKESYRDLRDVRDMKTQG